MPGLASGRWLLDPQRSTVEFRVPFYWGLGTVKGRFRRYRGTLDLRANPAIELTLDADSVATGNTRRDRRLRGSDFLAVSDHPHVRFVSEAADLHGDTLSVRGQLAAGAGHVAVELEATLRESQGEYELRAETYVMHRWLGMTWNPMGITRPYSKLLVAGRLVALRPNPEDGPKGRSRTVPTSPGARRTAPSASGCSQVSSRRARDIAAEALTRAVAGEAEGLKQRRTSPSPSSAPFKQENTASPSSASGASNTPSADPVRNP
jgi:polyisoprenoid-binding protein YceI